MRRDVALDLLRGYCIVSMVLAHLAPGHQLTAVVHVVPNFDGLSGFVLLSGLVLGMIQRRRFDREGVGPVLQQGRQRWRLLLRVHLVLVVTTLLVVALGDPDYAFADRDWAWWDWATLGIVPLEASVMRLYLVLMLLVLPAYFLLARGRVRLLLAVSVGIAVAGWLWPTLGTIPAPVVGLYYDPQVVALWTGWQLVFVLPLVLGWFWSDLDVSTWLARRTWFVAVACAAAVVAGWVFTPLAPALFSKYDAAPGRVFVAFAFAFGAYAVLAWGVDRWPHGWLRPVQMLGRRSLDSYVIHAVVLCGPLALWPPAPGAAAGLVVALLTLSGAWAWAEWREPRRWPRSGGTSRAPRTATV